MASAIAYDPTPSRSKLSVRGGVILPSRVRIDGGSFKTDIGLSGGVSLDIPIGTGFFYSVLLDIYDIQPQNFEIRRKFFDASLAFKKRYPLNDKLTEIRIGVAVGVGAIAKIDRVLPNRATFLTLKTLVEASFKQSRKFAWNIELSILGSPVGGYDDVDVTFGPTAIVRLGVSF